MATVKIDVTNLNVVKNIMDILYDILKDERIPHNIRAEYFDKIKGEGKLDD